VYLKRLELYGFKSFASPTSFHFGHGITAIVGPNGSGKSNIADALRWVLGEQSSRLLRAKKLDDIIYAGSARRAKAGRAEVAIVLDNSNGWLPIDVPEVTITRKATRSGDSDYFLNGKKTRLREIQALLIKGAASQSSYAIIGQGLVESVLNLRPEERRELIEEAADIQRYRLKIEEVQDRLKATHDNVERVRLLMKEISPRLAQLERQAQRAGEHSRLSRELTAALRVYYEHQWRRAQESLTVARASHDQAQAEFTQAKVALETCQRELEDVTAQLEEYRAAAAAARAERERIEARRHELERNVAVAAERSAILQSRRKELEEEIAVLELEKAQAEKLLGEDAARAAEREAAVARARAELEARQQELAEFEREYRELLDHIAETEGKGRRLQSAATEMQARARRIAEGARAAEKEAAKSEARRRSLVTQMSEQQALLRGHRAQEEQLLAEVSQAGARRQALEADVQKLRRQLADAEAVQNERRGKVEGLQARLAVMDDAQRMVGAAQPGGEVTIEGALGTLFEAIRVPRGLEQAIAAALEDQLEVFIFERQGEAVSAIKSLVEQRGPRTAALALDAIKQVYPLNIMKEKGVLGVASRLIKYPARYEKLINALLGRTLVVQDIETALKVLRRGLGAVVTVDGIIFHPSGKIAGGQPQNAQPFILGYERDLESIPREIERINRSLAVSEREANALRERLQEAEALLASLTARAEEALQKRASLQSSLSRRQQKLAELRGEMRSLVASQAAARREREQALAEVQRLEKEAEATLAEARGALESAKVMARSNKLMVERRAQLEKAVQDTAEAFAKADGEFRATALQKEAAAAAIARLEAQASAKAVQLRGLEMELTTLQPAAASGQRELAELRRRLEELFDRVPGGETSHHLEARQRDLHSQVLKAQGRVFESERLMLESEADVRRWEIEIENLASHMAEDGMAMSPEGEVVAPQAVQTRIPFWLSAEGGDDPGAGGLRPISGGAHVDPEVLAGEIERLRAQIRSLGPVNVEALGDYQSMKDRHDFLARQISDLEGAEDSLKRAIEQLSGLMKTRFEMTCKQVAKAFEENFHAFFGEGGQARLFLSDPRRPTTSGVEIEARPPGKRTRSLTQLSGGEKALTAVSLLFALLQANPAPFCVLDEVDAMLDEANVARFASALKELSKRTQFIVITHNRRTIETADSIYGVSMSPDAASRVLSMRLADVTKAADINLN
jgi:chromosome segregation protein